MLRSRLQELDLRGFLIPRADEFQGEYVPAHAQRLAWISGFTGSAGMAVVLDDQAAIFVDGRYTLQVRQQVDQNLFTPHHQTESPLTAWLTQVLHPADRLGFDPWLHTIQQVEQLQTACQRAEAVLIPCEDNPLDHVWTGRPHPPHSQLVEHPLDLAGKSSADKRRDVADSLCRDGLDAAVISDPCSLAWLLNVRGHDVPHLPVALCFGILHRDATVDLFLQAERLPAALAEQWGDHIRRHDPLDLNAFLDQLAGCRVRLDPGQCAHAIAERLRQAGASLDLGVDPCAMPKSCKNEVELRGAIAAHRRDAVAMVRFLAWFSRQSQLDELTAARQIDLFRLQHPLCRDLSFSTIAGSGPNGAIVHYQADAASNRPLQAGELFLLDSGGQYADGTTDITRTMIFGTATAQQRRHYTLVLKGHIAIARARFPHGTTGPQLDCLARQFLWAEGLDYDHGTGHGVGSYLSVHEGPQRISKMGDKAVALQPGMILSNEPGYYRTGDYGIRLENLIAVQDLGIPPMGERPLRGFQTLTQVPFDRALIESGLLTTAERDWLNTYHQQVQTALDGHLDPEDAEWLAAACAPLAGDDE